MAIKKPPKADSKTEEVCRKLRALAYEKGPGAQLPTVRVLCELLNTTYVTLDEALDQLEGEKLLYRKQRQGIFVSPTIHQRQIAILFNSSSIFFENQGSKHVMSPFWSLMWTYLEHEVQRRAQFKDEHCVFHLVKGSQTDPQNSLSAEFIEQLRYERLHGILAINLNIPVTGLPNLPVPCVSFAGTGSWIVQLDGKDTGQQAAIALVQQGCQKIGIWVPSNVHNSLGDFNEVSGIKHVLEERHLPFYPELARQLTSSTVASTKSQWLSHQEQGYVLVHEVFSSPDDQRPDGLFIADDLLTDGALVAFEEMNIRVGRDIKLVTQANVGSPILFGRTRHMTVLEYDPDNVIKALFTLLDQLLDEPQLERHVVVSIPSKELKNGENFGLLQGRTRE